MEKSGNFYFARTKQQIELDKKYDEYFKQLSESLNQIHDKIFNLKEVPYEIITKTAEEHKKILVEIMNTNGYKGADDAILINIEIVKKLGIDVLEKADNIRLFTNNLLNESEKNEKNAEIYLFLAKNYFVSQINLATSFVIKEIKINYEVEILNNEELNSELNIKIKMLDSIGISKSSPNNQFENFKKKHKLWKTHKDNYSKLEKLFQDNQDLIEIEQKKEFLKKWKSVEGDKIYTKIKEGLDNIKNDFIEKQKEDFSLIGIGKKIEVPNQEFEEFKKNHKLWKEYSEKLSKLKTLFKSCPDPKSDIFTINNFLKKKKEYGFNEVEILLNQFKFDFDMKNTLEEIQRQYIYVNDKDFCENIVKKLPKEKIDNTEINIDISEQEIQKLTDCFSEIHKAIFINNRIPYDLISETQKLFSSVRIAEGIQIEEGRDSTVPMIKEFLKKLDGETLKKVQEITSFFTLIIDILDSKKNIGNNVELENFLFKTAGGMFIANLGKIVEINKEINSYYETYNSVKEFRNFHRKLEEIGEKTSQLPNECNLIKEHLDVLFESLRSIEKTSKLSVLDMTPEQRQEFVNQWNKLKKSEAFKVVELLFNDEANEGMWNPKEIKEKLANEGLITINETKSNNETKSKLAGFNKDAELWKNYPKWEKLQKDWDYLDQLCSKHDKGEIDDIQFKRIYNSLEKAGLLTNIANFNENIVNYLKNTFDLLNKEFDLLNKEFDSINIGENEEVSKEMKNFIENHKNWKNCNETHSELNQFYNKLPKPESESFGKEIYKFLSSKEYSEFEMVKQSLEQIKIEFDVKNSIKEVNRKFKEDKDFSWLDDSKLEDNLSIIKKQVNLSNKDIDQYLIKNLSTTNFNELISNWYDDIFLNNSFSSDKAVEFSNKMNNILTEYAEKTGSSAGGDQWLPIQASLFAELNSESFKKLVKVLQFYYELNLKSVSKTVGDFQLKQEGYYATSAKSIVQDHFYGIISDHLKKEEKKE